MCKNLVEKGNLAHPLIIYNRTTSKAEALSSQIGHSKVARSVEEAVAEADIIFVCLGDDDAVTATMEAAVKSADVTGKLFVDCSTVHPTTTSREAAAYTAKGAGFVAMPVFGAPAMADSGQLLCVPAGPAEWTAKVIPYTTGVMGRANIDVSGQDPAKATLLKVLGNTMILSMVEALAEGHVAAEKTGLGSADFHAFIEQMFSGPYTGYSNRMRGGDYYRRPSPLFAIDLARKDARHAQALANAAGVTMHNVERGDGYLKAVKEHMGARGDIAGIYGAKRVEAGLKFENGD